jgi:hypothetical protein
MFAEGVESLGSRLSNFKLSPFLNKITAKVKGFSPQTVVKLKPSEVVAPLNSATKSTPELRQAIQVSFLLFHSNLIKLSLILLCRMLSKKPLVGWKALELIRSTLKILSKQSFY